MPLGMDNICSRCCPHQTTLTPCTMDMCTSLRDAHITTAPVALLLKIFSGFMNTPKWGERSRLPLGSRSATSNLKTDSRYACAVCHQKAKDRAWWPQRSRAHSPFKVSDLKRETSPTASQEHWGVIERRHESFRGLCALPSQEPVQSQKRRARTMKRRMQ